MGEAEPVHLAGHHDIGEHEVDAVFLDLAQCRLGIGDAVHVIAELLQKADADGGDVRIVLDEQHRAAAVERWHLRRSRAMARFSPRGRRMEKVVPLPSSLATFTVPPA